MNTSNVIHADLNDIIFDGRNKSYGAYFIRKNQSRNTMNAFYIAASVFVGLMLFLCFYGKPVMAIDSGTLITDPEKQYVPVVFPPEDKEKEDPVQDEEPTSNENTQQEETHADPDPGDTQRYVAVNAEENVDDENSTASEEDLENRNPGFETSDGAGFEGNGGDPGDDGTGGPGISNANPGDDDKDGDDDHDWEVFTGIEPVPMNMDEIRNAIGYPIIAREAELEGDVIYRVQVDEKGNYIKHKVMRSSHPIFDKACKEQIEKLKFIPGRIDDKAVKVWVIIPFKFRLRK